MISISILQRSYRKHYGKCEDRKKGSVNGKSEKFKQIWTSVDRIDEDKGNPIDVVNLQKSINEQTYDSRLLTWGQKASTFDSFIICDVTLWKNAHELIHATERTILSHTNNTFSTLWERRHTSYTC